MATAFQSNAFQNNAFQISTVTPDTHDGIFDAELYRKLRKKLAGKRQDLLAEDTERTRLLRKAVESVVRRDDVPAEIKREVAVKSKEPDVDFGPIAADLLALNLQMKTAQRAILEAAAAEWERQDEEDIEMLLGEIF